MSKERENVQKLKYEAQNQQEEGKRQVKLTKNLNERVENTEIKMKKIDGKLDKFVANTSDKKVWWYIVAQVVIFVILIIA